MRCVDRKSPSRFSCIRIQSAQQLWQYRRTGDLPYGTKPLFWMKLKTAVWLPPWQLPASPQFRMYWILRLISSPVAFRAILMRSPKEDRAPCAQQLPQYYYRMGEEEKSEQVIIFRTARAITGIPHRFQYFFPLISVRTYLRNMLIQSMCGEALTIDVAPIPVVLRFVMACTLKNCIGYENWKKW